MKINVLPHSLIADLKISLREYSEMRFYLEGITLPSIKLYKKGDINPLDVRKSFAACNIGNDCTIIVTHLD